MEKKRESLLSVAKRKLSGVKKAVKKAVATGAKKVAKGALGVASKMEKEKPSPVQSKAGVRSARPRSGIGGGKRVEVAGEPKKEQPVKKVSVKDVTSKKAEKPSDPWEGSATTPPKAKKKKAAAPKAKTTKVSGGTSKAPARKKKSKLDDLLASVRSEETQLDKKTLTPAEKKKREEIVMSMKDKAAEFEKRYPGRGEEVMYATATKIAKEIAK